MKRSFHVRSSRPATRGTSSFLLALLFLVLIFSLAGNAQQLTATLTGTVTDASGAVVPGATIVVHSEDTNADIRSVVSSNTGDFNITNISAGRYTVTVKLEGFQTFAASGVILNVAEKHSLDVQLKAGKVSERSK